MRKISLHLTMLLLLYALESCSHKVVSVQSAKRSAQSFVVLPFENYTETPLAGLRVASIAEGVLVSKGYKLRNPSFSFEAKEYTQEEINALIEKLEGVDYALTGSVNEFRYKTGIDGEPAVSITVKIYSVREKKPIYISTASQSGWYFQSVSSLAQKILDKIIPSKLPR